jgi:hypothetical protein
MMTMSPGASVDEGNCSTGEEELAVDWPVEHARGVDPVVAQRGKEGQCAPVADGTFA